MHRPPHVLTFSQLTYIVGLLVKITPFHIDSTLQPTLPPFYLSDQYSTWLNPVSQLLCTRQAVDCGWKTQTETCCWSQTKPVVLGLFIKSAFPLSIHLLIFLMCISHFATASSLQPLHPILSFIWRLGLLFPWKIKSSQKWTSFSTCSQKYSSICSWPMASNLPSCYYRETGHAPSRGNYSSHIHPPLPYPMWLFHQFSLFSPTSSFSLPTGSFPRAYTCGIIFPILKQ